MRAACSARAPVLPKCGAPVPAKRQNSPHLPCGQSLAQAGDPSARARAPSSCVSAPVSLKTFSVVLGTDVAPSRQSFSFNRTWALWAPTSEFPYVMSPLVFAFGNPSSPCSAGWPLAFSLLLFLWHRLCNPLGVSLMYVIRGTCKLLCLTKTENTTC